jgi:Golgi nucleoside diphosphatase
VFPVDPQIVHSLFWNVFNRIMEGEQFKDGDTAGAIASGGYLVKFVDAIENGRPVLRTLFCCGRATVISAVTP